VTNLVKKKNKRRKKKNSVFPSRIRTTSSCLSRMIMSPPRKSKK
jgi:hypothetical protein